MLELIDTHCHIHEAQASGDSSGVAARWQDGGMMASQMIDEASQTGVKKLMCVGTTLEDSQLAIELAAAKSGIFASIGIHPHEAKDYVQNPTKLRNFRNLIEQASPADRSKIKAVGECGLDYYYNHSPKLDQQKVLIFQIELAIEFNLPLIFHVRNAFDDFWPIFNRHKGLRGVLHSFTDNQDTLAKAIQARLFLGLNGIMTFTKDSQQIEVAKAIPLENLLLETDAPFLTPAPFRGTICQPKHVKVTAEFLAKLRGEDLEKLSEQTTANAKELFGI